MSRRLREEQRTPATSRLSFCCLRISGMENRRRSATDGRTKSMKQTVTSYFRRTESKSIPCFPTSFVSLLEGNPDSNGKYSFWSGTGKPGVIVGSGRGRLRKLFQTGRGDDGHAHRFRDFCKFPSHRRDSMNGV